MGRRRELDEEFLNLLNGPVGEESRPARPAGPACERCGSSADVVPVSYLRGEVRVSEHLCVICKGRRLTRVRVRQEAAEEAAGPRFGFRRGRGIHRR